MADSGKTEFEKLAQKPNTHVFRVPEIPSLYLMMMTNGFKEGPQIWDAKMKEWRTNLEREINARIVKAPEIQTGNPG